tara:strand:+ start:2331 stop:3032 length:702 start_codon:yes stop_codon:yes gene_type:complete
MWDILIVDRSASMVDNIDNIKKGFKELIDEQIKQKSENRFTVMGFNTSVKILSDDMFPEIPDVSDEIVKVGGMTALLDAVGNAYNLILKQNKLKSITLTIITDGMENSSKDYTVEVLDKMKTKIDTDYSLNMVFIGADKMCLYGNPIALHASQSVDCNGDLLKAMRTASSTMSSQRECTEYTPEGVVNIKSTDLLINRREVSPLVMKRQPTIALPSDTPCCPIVKRFKVDNLC